MNDKIWTVLELLNWTTPYFQNAQLDSPRLSAELLLAHVLRCQRIELYTRFDQQPTPDELSAFRDLVKRAASHEPIAYLTGTKEFYSLTFAVTPSVLIPRPETELLVDRALEHLRSLDQPGQVWDACTGSGCVASAIAHNAPNATVLATDICPDAVDVARGNADSLGLADRVTCTQADLLTLPEDWPGDETFDIITANPPYVGSDDWVATSVKHEPDLALYAGANGLDLIARLLKQVPEYLAPDGCFLMEFGQGQTPRIAHLVEQIDALAPPTFQKDHQGIDRILIARLK
jgi:release factor glutamine methyltransferase